MKRLHVHVRVENLEKSIAFYSAMFNKQPTIAQPDYAKWMLDDPRVNFAITPATDTVGVDHLGIQVESGDELQEMHGRLEKAEAQTVSQVGANCCYARSDKYWSQDPQGIAWEMFHSLSSIPVFGGDLQPRSDGEGSAVCCQPEMSDESVAAADASATDKRGCC